MSKFTQPARTVRDIKTLAGKADDLLTPHKMYMRLFALETERHRRQQERASAMLRVASIDTRCAEIDQEKQELLRILGVEAVPVAAPAGEPLGPVANPIADPRRRRPRIGRPTASAGSDTPIYESVKIRY